MTTNAIQISAQKAYYPTVLPLILSSGSQTKVVAAPSPEKKTGALTRWIGAAASVLAVATATPQMAGDMHEDARTSFSNTLATAQMNQNGKKVRVGGHRLLPATGFFDDSATEAQLHAEWTAYTAPNGLTVSGFNLYRSTVSGQNGNFVGNVAAAGATQMDVIVPALQDQRTYFSLTAAFTDNTESPHSTQFPFIITGGLATSTYPNMITAVDFSSSQHLLVIKSGAVDPEAATLVLQAQPVFNGITFAPAPNTFQTGIYTSPFGGTGGVVPYKGSNSTSVCYTNGWVKDFDGGLQFSEPKCYPLDHALVGAVRTSPTPVTLANSLGQQVAVSGARVLHKASSSTLKLFYTDLADSDINADGNAYALTGVASSWMNNVQVHMNPTTAAVTVVAIDTATNRAAKLYYKASPSTPWVSHTVSLDTPIGPTTTYPAINTAQKMVGFTMHDDGALLLHTQAKVSGAYAGYAYRISPEHKFVDNGSGTGPSFVQTSSGAAYKPTRMYNVPGTTGQFMAEYTLIAAADGFPASTRVHQVKNATTLANVGNAIYIDPNGSLDAIVQNTINPPAGMGREAKKNVIGFAKGKMGPRVEESLANLGSPLRPRGTVPSKDEGSSSKHPGREAILATLHERDIRRLTPVYGLS